MTTPQSKIVLTMLKNYPSGVCGTIFLQCYIPRYSARIGELRGLGYEIETKRCKNESHHHITPQYKFCLTESEEGTQMTMETTNAN